MIAEQKQRTVTSNLQGEEIQMGFDENSLVHLMSILTDLYSDKELAIIREYSTNALDAQIEAGISRPIDVTLPTNFSPFFKVRDYGIGLNAEDLRDIYSKYGASTKRGTNSQVGMLGLGCKSALSYTDQFTVTSVKDGLRVQVSVSRNEEGAGSMTIVDSSPTDDKSGTEIIVPVRNAGNFQQKAQQFYRFWEKGTVLVNGNEPEHFEGDLIAPGVYLVESHETPKVVMGNVAYPADIPLDFGYGKSLVAFVGIGDVTFPPSREALQYDDKTKKRCEKIHVEAIEGLRKRIVADIDLSPTRRDAIFSYLRWQRKIPSSYLPTPMTYKGLTLPLKIEAAPPVMKTIKNWKDEDIKVQDEEKTEKWTHVARRPHKFSDSVSTRAIEIDRVPSTLWVKNFDAAKWTPTMRKKLDLWLTTNDDNSLISDRGFTTGYTDFILLNPASAIPSSPWIDAKQCVEWEDIKSLKLPKIEHTSSGRLAGSYDMYNASSEYLCNGIAADDIDTDEPIYYYIGTSAGYQNEILRKAEPDCTLVVFHDRRKDKFLRMFPTAVNADVAVQKICDEWVKTLDPQDRLALTIRMHSYGTRDSLNALKRYSPELKDPKLRTAIKAAGRDIEKMLKEVRRFQNIAVSYNAKVKWENPLNAYPLYSASAFRSAPQHVVNYLNDSYARTLTNPVV